MASKPVIDSAVLESLLVKSDDAWFMQRAGKTDYRGHIRHTADYISRNYARERRRLNNGSKKPRASTVDKSKGTKNFARMRL